MQNYKERKQIYSLKYLRRTKIICKFIYHIFINTCEKLKQEKNDIQMKKKYSLLNSCNIILYYFSHTSVRVNLCHSVCHRTYDDI